MGTRLYQSDESRPEQPAARVTAQSVSADGLGAQLTRVGEAMIAAHLPR